MPDKHRHKPVPAKEIFLKGVLVHNPVLVQLIGICPVAAAAVSLRAGVMLAAVSSLIIIATHVTASVFLKRIVRWVRVAVYLLIGLAFTAPAGWLLEQYQPDMRRTLGIYLPLLAANSLIALRCEKVAVRSSVKHSLLDSIAVSIGYSVVILLTGFIRELLGSGEILEKTVRFLPAAPGLLLPFGGFLVLGFMAAALKGVVMRQFPKYAKAMGIEISPTAVTMKLKPEEDNDPALQELDTAEPLPVPQGPAAENIAGDEPPEVSVVNEHIPQKTPGETPAREPELIMDLTADQDMPSIPEDRPEAAATENLEGIQSLAGEPEEPDTGENTVQSPQPESPPEDRQTAAVQVESPPAQPRRVPADDTGFNLRLKELFDYLDELEKETKNKQDE